MAPFVRLFVNVALAAALSLPPAAASVLLKPKGENGMPLTARSLEATVAIRQQIADTRLLMTFHNEVNQRIEADFIYTAPPGAVVTYFAYWYGDEKVVARVVEKERAAAIYRHITSRMRDPALIEMIGKNTFRARIFPVMPNSDLKIEMALVQALPTDATGATYELPLPREETLDSVRVDARVTADPGIERVANNIGLPVAREGDEYRLTLAGTRYRPQKNLRLTVIYKPRPLRAALYAARSGGPDGFFALALTPDRTLSRPTVTIRGVATHTLLPARLAEVAAGRSLFLYGRYRGSGTAEVLLSGRSAGRPVTYRQSVRFVAAAEPNNPATRLWAAERIEALSASVRNRDEVIRLSTRYTLPSKFTSWLAVPGEEKERYEQEIAWGEASAAARELAGHVVRGTGRSRAARAARARLNRWAPKAGSKPAELLRDAIGGYRSERVWRAADELARHAARGTEGSPSARRLERNLRRWAAEAGEDPRWALTRAFSDALDETARIVVDEERGGGSAAPRSKGARRRLASLSARSGRLPGEAVGEEISRRIHRLTATLPWLPDEPVPDAARVASLEAELDRWARLADRLLGPKGPWPYSGYPWDRNRKSGAGSRPSEARVVQGAREALLRVRILMEHAKKNPDPERVARLEREFVSIASREYAGAEEHARSRVGVLQVRGQRQRVRRQIARADIPEGSVELAALKKDLAELDRREEELRVRMGDPLIRIEAPADALHAVALLGDGQVKPLAFNPASGCWEARFDVPAYAREGEYRITIITVLKDGTRRVVEVRYRVDLTPPAGAGEVSRVPGARAVRLELTASEDTNRVAALLPWGARAELQRSGRRPGGFFGVAPLPEGYPDGPVPVTFLLTDHAHNRTTLLLEGAAL